jgi:hypothetical protein
MKFYGETSSCESQAQRSTLIYAQSLLNIRAQCVSKSVVRSKPKGSLGDKRACSTWACRVGNVVETNNGMGESLTVIDNRYGLWYHDKVALWGAVTCANAQPPPARGEKFC